MLNIGKYNGYAKEGSPIGEIRQSQLITTFGIGSIVDFVDQSAMICGTDSWDEKKAKKISNPNLENLLGVKYFISPQVSEKSNFYSKGNCDVKATIFPKILYSQKCKRLVKARPDLLNNHGEFRCDCELCQNKVRLLPSPFILVCPGGHIEDFPYSWWVHKGAECSLGNDGVLTMTYIGNKTSLDSLYIKCSCKKMRSMEGAMNRGAFAEYKCKGYRPWLGDYVECHASEGMQMRRKAETSVYFPAVVSALSIPPWDGRAAHYIYDELSSLNPSVSITPQLLESYVQVYSSKFPDVSQTYIRRLIDEALNKKREMTLDELMKDEYDAILLRDDAGEQREDFIVREGDVPERYVHIIDRVVAIDRLTVVSAMTGFSMLTALPYNSKDLCALSKYRKSWRPGIEQRGEGIFIKFNQDMLDRWATEYKDRYSEMKANYETAKLRDENFSVQYVFLHTFAHLFIREISYLCGYSAASISERIYSTYTGCDSKMCGVLVYTSTSDSDGSLGGLVEQAKSINLEKILSSMTERGKWCSSDPVCYSSKAQGYRSLNYAACFACTLLPETSCELFNALLDRCSVCGSPEDGMLGFMNWI